MKYILILILILQSQVSPAQTTDTLKKKPDKASNVVTFITKVDIANATKDGIYMNGYVVNLDHQRAKKLNGKKIRVTGKVTIVRGLNDEEKKAPVQGRDGDTKHIESPKIEIIKN